MRLRSLSLLAVLISCSAAAQRPIFGTVTGADGAPVEGARVAPVASALAVYTDTAGAYALEVGPEVERLQVSAAGHDALEVFLGTVSRVDVELAAGLGLGAVADVGPGRPARPVRDAAAAVTVIDVRALAPSTPYATLGELLHYATTEVMALPRITGTPDDFVAPVALRGGGPGQVLVLVNGRRRHRSALLTTAEVFGSGRVGVDLEAIPLAAVSHVEVLRGPAAAAYGPDAVAGVLNVVLARERGLRLVAEGGAFASTTVPAPDAPTDGLLTAGSLYLGGRLGSRGGFASLTVDAARRDPTNRMRELEGPIFSGYNHPDDAVEPAADITAAELARRGLDRSDFRERAGLPAQDRGAVVLQAELPLRGSWRLYGNGDASVRRYEATARYARPNAAGTDAAVFPNGIAPLVRGGLDDQAGVLGARGRLGTWELDLSHGFGRSAYALRVDETTNPSAGPATPRSYGAGRGAFRQNISRVEARRYYPRALAGVHVSLGGGLRVEETVATAGEALTYARGSVTTDPLGRAIPGGTTGLTGFSDADAGARRRLSGFGYAELDADVGARFAIGAGVGYDLYEALAGGVSGSLRARLRLLDEVSLRASVSTGLRAPTLQEVSYRKTAADTLGLRSGTFAAGSPAARALGLSKLGLERYTGGSAGVAARLPGAGLELAVDGFLVTVDDAAALTGVFGRDPGRRDVARLLGEVGVGEARFLANAVSTRSYGLTADVRYAGGLPLGARLRLRAAATLARLEVLDVATSPQLIDREGVYLPASRRALLEEAVPATRANLTAEVDFRALTAMTRVMYFGTVAVDDEDPTRRRVYTGEPVVDASLAWRIAPVVTLAVGVANAFNYYPDFNRGPLREGGSAPYSRATQRFGSNGRYAFGRLRLGR